MAKPWELASAERLDDQVAIVTGSNSGIGLATAGGLRSLGAKVVLACRSVTRADEAADQMVASGPGPAPLVVRLDLEDLDSITGAIDEIHHICDHVDLLINNAGIMGPNGADSAHRQLWANHLGHVALTAGLRGDLEARAGKIVVVSSLVHRRGRLELADPLEISAQRPMDAYGSTKLMNLLFCFEADRRLRAARAGTSIRAAHPGNANSNLATNGFAKGRPGPLEAISSFLGDRLGQSAARGALPTLRAALDPSIPPGAYLGPSGPFELWGDPVPVSAAKRALDPAMAAALFDASIEAVGQSWPV
jgi:NAD(P)-dependent dehydrogenase (short-subunit alcohol dehydrogenase family)